MRLSVPALVVFSLLLSLPAFGQPFGNSGLMNLIEEDEPGGALPLRFFKVMNRDWDYLRGLVDWSTENGINGMILSHGVMAHIDWVLYNREHERHIREMIDYGHEKGLLMACWIKEIESVPEEYQAPDGRAILDERFWAWTRDRYERFFTLLPNLDAVVLTFHETQRPVYDDTKVVSDLAPVDRVIQLIRELADVCADHDTTLIVRTFAHTVEQVRWIGEGLQKIGRSEDRPGNLMVMSKDVPHDWQFYYPHNPFIGNVGGLPQIVEMDMGGEYWGSNRVPCVYPQYIQHRLAYGISKGIVGMAPRSERDRFLAMGNTGEANLYTYARLMLDPEADPHALLHDWCAKTYGEAAAEFMTPALERTFDIVRRIYYPKGVWTNPHSSLPSYWYANHVFLTHDTARWDPYNPILRSLKEDMLNPTDGTILEIRGEKEHARILWRRSMEDLERARPHLNEEQYTQLKRDFDFLGSLLQSFTVHHEALFRLMQYLSLERMEAPGEELARVRTLLLAAVDDLWAESNRVEAEWGQDVWPGNPRNMRAFILSYPIRRFRRHLLHRPLYRAPVAEVPIVVDGELDDWKMDHFIALDTPPQARYVRSWRGPADKSGFISLRWDEENLYLAAQVRDDVPRIRLDGGGQPWGDTLMLGFDLDRSEREFEWAPEDIVLKIALYEDAPILFRIHGEGSPNPDSAEVAGQEVPGGYRYEARFPWKDFFGLEPEAGKTIGFSVAVTDGDQDRQEGYMEWTVGLVEDRDAAAWGWIELVK